MPDRFEYLGKWICPQCNELVEETDPDLLEAKIKLHKCKELNHISPEVYYKGYEAAIRNARKC